MNKTNDEILTWLESVSETFSENSDLSPVLEALVSRRELELTKSEAESEDS